MGNGTSSQRIRIGSLAELDGLVARHLTGAAPTTFWEDSHAFLHCDTFEEAVEALHDPYFQQFTPEERDPDTVLREVRVFRPYSSDVDEALTLIEMLSGSAVFSFRFTGGRWEAAFGEQPVVQGRTAPLAICLAALRVRGIEVELDLERRQEMVGK